MKKGKIAVVVVTYNRENLLIESLNALTSQTKNPDSIYIIDNKSDLTTPQKLIDEGWIDKLLPYDVVSNERQLKTVELSNGKLPVEVVYVRKKENDGGAGGFYEGVKQAYSDGNDWVWLMDDDVIVGKESLEELIKASQLGDFGFLCSRVVGPNGISMNIPYIDYKKGKNYYPVWDDMLEHGLVRVSSATFVSVIIPSEIIKEVGFPVKEMFIWGDDAEYTLRISKKYPCYLAGKSIVEHKRTISKPPSLKTEKNRKRIKFHSFHVRNDVFIKRKHKSKEELVFYIFQSVYKILYFIVRLKFYRSFIIFISVVKGFFFNPKIIIPKN